MEEPIYKLISKDETMNYRMNNFTRSRVNRLSKVKFYKCFTFRFKKRVSLLSWFQKILIREK